MRAKTILCTLAVSLLATTAASAHPAAGAAGGFAHGFGHPLGGLDHLLAMLAVGVLAAHLGGRALWLVPASFMAMMVAGGALAMAAVGLPLVEIAIAASLVALGGALALGRSVPLAAAASLAGFFALFHGHAHGAEMPAAASGLAYGAGFVMATVALHGAGLALGLGLGRIGKAGPRLASLGGGAMALAGVAILAGLA